MPAFTPISLMDGKSTPAAHVFDLTSNGAGRTVMHNRAATMLIGQENLVVEVKQPSGKGGAFRASVSLGVPVTSTDVNGKSVISHVSSGKTEFNFAQTSTRAERKDDVALMISALQNALIEEAILDIEPFYG